MIQKVFLIVFLNLILCFPANSTESHSSTSVKDKTVFIGVIIKNYDQLVAPFLKSLEKLDYDKKQIALQISFYNNSPIVKKQVALWAKKNRGDYLSISYPQDKASDNFDPTLLNYHPLKKFKFFGEIRNEYLKKTKELNHDYCFILDSDVFLEPITLKYLIGKEKPIITPVLRPSPDSSNTFCNFLGTTNEKGFFNFDYNFFSQLNLEVFYKNYWDISSHTETGTFPIASAFGAYLINSQYINKLAFTDEIPSEDFFALGRSAKANHVEHYICNEKEFGSLTFFNKPLSLSEEKQFSLAGSDIEINAPYIKKLLSQYCTNDSELKKYLDRFSFEEYALFRVENADLFYLDDCPDFIKTLYLKKGKVWERHIQEVLKKYTKPGTLAIDIGGHIGTHTLTLSRALGSKGKVHVFEPQIKLFPELVINMNINGCKNITFHRSALGKEKSQGKLTLPCSTNEGMCRIDSSSQTGEPVSIETLDSFHLKNVSIMKIDVEGFESDVIQGAKDTILRNKPVIILEIFPNSELEQKKEMVKNLGYEVVFLGNDDYLFLPISKKK